MHQIVFMDDMTIYDEFLQKRLTGHNSKP
jgi:hypothetical protein